MTDIGDAFQTLQAGGYAAGHRILHRDIGVQEVLCEDCGTSLGTQAIDQPVDRALWPHGGCPERVARDLGVSRLDYETALRVATASINNAYPDLSAQHETRLFRAGMAAAAVLEALGGTGLTLQRRTDIRQPVEVTL